MSIKDKRFKCTGRQSITIVFQLSSLHIHETDLSPYNSSKEFVLEKEQHLLVWPAWGSLFWDPVSKPQPEKSWFYNLTWMAGSCLEIGPFIGAGDPNSSKFNATCMSRDDYVTVSVMGLERSLIEVSLEDWFVAFHSIINIWACNWRGQIFNSKECHCFEPYQHVWWN